VVAAETTTHHGSWVINSNPHSQQGRRSQGCCPAERSSSLPWKDWHEGEQRRGAEEMNENNTCVFLCIGFSAGVKFIFFWIQNCKLETTACCPDLCTYASQSDPDLSKHHSVSCLSPWPICSFNEWYLVLRHTLHSGLIWIYSPQSISHCGSNCTVWLVATRKRSRRLYVITTGFTAVACSSAASAPPFSLWQHVQCVLLWVRRSS